MPIVQAIEEDPRYPKEERKGHKGFSAADDLLGRDVSEIVLFDPMHQVRVKKWRMGQRGGWLNLCYLLICSSTWALPSGSATVCSR